MPGVGEPCLDGELPFMIESTPESFDILGIDVVQGRRFTAEGRAPPTRGKGIDLSGDHDKPFNQGRMKLIRVE